jgi:hypothetical protein
LSYILQIITIALGVFAAPDPARRLDEAQVLYERGNYQKAIYAARPLTSTRLKVRAWRIVGVASCRLRDVPQANEAYVWLDPGGRPLVIDVCRRAGVLFENGRFVEP